MSVRSKIYAVMWMTLAIYIFANPPAFHAFLFIVSSSLTQLHILTRMSLENVQSYVGQVQELVFAAYDTIMDYVLTFIVNWLIEDTNWTIFSWAISHPIGRAIFAAHYCRVDKHSCVGWDRAWRY
jgi:hypothetical protein